MTALAGTLEGLRVLDLFAGSGAVGLEAASRGAAAVVLVESDPRAVKAIRSNIATLDIPGVGVVPLPVEKAVAGPCPGPGFDVAFLDPPYAHSAESVTGVLEALLAGSWLAPGALVAVERASRRGEFAWPAALSPLRERSYGEGTIHYAEL